MPLCIIVVYNTAQKNSSTDNPPDDRHRSDVVSETRLLYHCCSRIVINHKALSVLTYLLLSLAAQNANGALRNSDIVCLFHFLRLFVCSFVSRRKLSNLELWSLLTTNG